MLIRCFLYFKGVLGVKGLKGDTGPDGAEGNIGSRGEKGQPGVTGQKGLKVCIPHFNCILYVTRYKNGIKCTLIQAKQ